MSPPLSYAPTAGFSLDRALQLCPLCVSPLPPPPVRTTAGFSLNRALQLCPLCVSPLPPPPVRTTAGFSLNRALQLGLPKYMTDIDEMSEYASKEYSLERTLDKMQVREGGGEMK